MTLEALNLGIERLIIKRAKLVPFSQEQEEVNNRLEKLYDLKYLMIEQQLKKQTV